MDIRQLDYFIAVAQRGNFTKAADELFITRQALSKAVRNLEHELHVPLLLNRDGHLGLTDAGRALRDDAEPVVRAFKELEARYAASSPGASVRQSLSVAMAHGTAISLPDRAVDAFRDEHPDVLLSIEEVSTDAALDMARAGECDIGLVGSSPQYLAEFDIALVVETGVYVFVPQENPLSQRGTLALVDLDGMPFVTFGKRNHLHRYFLEACAEAGARPDVLMTTSDAALLVRSADQQRALYFGFPPSVHAEERERHVLVRVDMGRDDTFGTYAVKRRGAGLTSAARAFWEYLLKL